MLGSWWATFSNELKLTKRVHWAQILQKYSGLERETGRSLLESLCRSKHHLKVPDITPYLSAWHYHSIRPLPHLSITIIHSYLLLKLNTRSSAIFSIGIKKWEIQSDPELAYLISELDLKSSLWMSRLWKIEDYNSHWYWLNCVVRYQEINSTGEAEQVLVSQLVHLLLFQQKIKTALILSTTDWWVPIYCHLTKRTLCSLQVPANVYVKKTALGQQTIDISGLAAPSSEKKEQEASSTNSSQEVKLKVSVMFKVVMCSQ